MKPSLAHSGAARRVSLLLVASPPAARPVLERVADFVRQEAPDVVPYVCADRRLSYAHVRSLLRPSLSWSPRRPQRFQPWRGFHLSGSWLKKSEEYRRLEGVGLPVPRWTILSPQDTPDLQGFGSYVVTKPDHGALGADVRIRRTSRLRWKPPTTAFVRKGWGETPNYVVQQFVYTGPWPITYRVTMMFGEPLLMWRQEARHQLRPLAGSEDFRGDAVSIVSSGRGCRFELVDDPELIALARRVHEAFAEFPVLGIDMVREQGSGRVFVLEVNPMGVWHFGTAMGMRIQREQGICFESQFDGLRKTAKLLAERGRSQAR